MRRGHRIARLTHVTVATMSVLVMAGGVARAATGVVGPHKTGIVNCSSPDSVSVTALAPMIKAVNRTSSTDYQNVAFQPVLFRWDGSTWRSDQVGMKLYGRASDVTSPTSWRDWVTGSNVGDGRQTFSMMAKGHYAVAVRMYWYNTSWQVTGSDYLWTTTYLTPIGAVAHYCTR